MRHKYAGVQDVATELNSNSGQEWANKRMRYRATSIARLCRLAQAAVKT